jgi:hypothetical protein
MHPRALLDRLTRALPLVALAGLAGLASSFALGAGDGDPRRLGVVATGGTQAYLETCGCAEGQFGGISRRAYQTALMRQTGALDLLLDAGGFVHGENRFDRLVSETHVQAMRRMGAFAANVTGPDLSFGLEALALWAKAGPPHLVSTNLAAPGAPWRPQLAASLKGREVLVLGVCEPAEVTARAIPGLEARDPAASVRAALAALARRPSLVVLLSGLSGEKNRRLAAEVPGIDLVVQRDEGRVEERVGATTIVSCVSQGKALVEAAVRFDARGEVEGAAARRIMLGDGVQTFAWAEEMLRGFYEAVRRDEGLQREATRGLLFPVALEGERGGYAGTESCKDCHAREHEDHERQGHAVAYDALLRKNKAFQPNCVQCHVVGFGAPGGFRDLRSTPKLTGVGCESCHGPGRLHAREPRRDNIAGKVPLDHCRKCHYGNNDPRFEEHAGEKWAKVNHTRPLPGRGGQTLSEHRLSELVDAPLASAGSAATPPATSAGAAPTATASAPARIRVDLFWMSLCPFGAEAVRALVPLAKELPEAIDLRVHYIALARALAGEAVRYQEQAGSGAAGARCNAVYDFAPDAPFTSLHGQEEVDEDIRQVTIAARWPAQHLDYLALRARDVQDRDWRAAAKKVGLDPAAVEKAAAESGAALFLEDVRLAHILNVQSSPTIFVGGRRYEGPIDRIDLARAARGLEPGPETRADVWTRLPACTEDRHCAAPGKIGVCVNPGRPDARCEAKDPVPFEVTVLRHPACPNCPTGPLLKEILSRFTAATVEDVLVTSERGRALVAAHGVTRTPFYVLGGAVERAHRFREIEGSLERRGDVFVLKQAGGPFALLEPYLMIDPPFWDAGEVAVGAPVERTFALSNLSGGALLVRGVRSLFPDLEAALEPAPAAAGAPAGPPGASAGERPPPRLRLRLTPAREGAFRRYVWVESNDGGRPAVSLTVQGVARKPAAPPSAPGAR